jgi:hypothetical protein
MLIALVGALLWLLPMGLLVATQGWGGTLTQMGWFFTKAALLTFGGAYAVLPYVYQGAVGQYHWLTPTQMIDGLALGETTPGPLIMVVAFVAFVGGYLRPMIVHGGCGGSGVSYVVYLSTLVPVHSGRRAAGGIHAWRSEIHRTTDRDHFCSGGRDPEPCAFLRLSRAVADWL